MIASNRIIQTIEKKYTKDEAIVSAQFAKNLLSSLWHELRTTSVDGRLLDEELKVLDVEITNGKITAGELKKKILDFQEQVVIHEERRKSEDKIRLLEKRVQDLRDAKSSDDLTLQVSELQKQVNSLTHELLKAKQLTKEERDDQLRSFMQAKRKAFIIMPFDPLFDDVWIGAIQRACLEAEYTSIRVDEVSLSSIISKDIETLINNASVVIVDITGNNPNVMFELGWSLARKKNLIVICQKNQTEKIPFDVKFIRYIEYINSWRGIEELVSNLKRFLLVTDAVVNTNKKSNLKIK
jgi:hypothetical protein